MFEREDGINGNNDDLCRVVAGGWRFRVLHGAEVLTRSISSSLARSARACVTTLVWQ